MGSVVFSSIISNGVWISSGMEISDELVEINELSEESRSVVMTAGWLTVLAVVRSFVEWFLEWNNKIWFVDPW